ncbi:MAG: HigA family addiction module antidote protein [Bdellovibrionales bacterium]|nr:HigA family addiction module antidote protein [Bdellovibrionales bacterium]
MSKTLSPIPPGEILLEEFMSPSGISQNKLARDIDVPPGRINDIIRARRAITTDTALRLSVYFGTTPEFWLNLQNAYDLNVAQQELLPGIRKIVRPLEKAAV